MKVKVISQDNCAPCETVKNYLNDKNVKFEEINVSHDRSAIETYNVMSTPVTILFNDNEEVTRVNGFDVDDLDSLVKQL